MVKIHKKPRHNKSPQLFNNPYFTWLLTLGTSGFYFYIWALVVAIKINRLNERDIIPIQLFGNNLLMLLMLSIELFKLSSVYHTIFFTLIPPTLVLIFTVYIQWALGHYIKTHLSHIQMKPGYSHITSFLLLFLVVASGSAYMQHYINKITAYKHQLSYEIDTKIGLELTNISFYTQLVLTALALISPIFIYNPLH